MFLTHLWRLVEPKEFSDISEMRYRQNSYLMSQLLFLQQSPHLLQMVHPRRKSATQTNPVHISSPLPLHLLQISQLDCSYLPELHTNTTHHKALTSLPVLWWLPHSWCWALSPPCGTCTHGLLWNSTIVWCSQPFPPWNQSPSWLSWSIEHQLTHLVEKADTLNSTSKCSILTRRHCTIDTEYAMANCSWVFSISRSQHPLLQQTVKNLLSTREAMIPLHHSTSGLHPGKPNKPWATSLQPGCCTSHCPQHWHDQSSVLWWHMEPCKYVSEDKPCGSSCWWSVVGMVCEPSTCPLHCEA